MSISNKVRAMLNIAGKKPADLSECLDVSVQAVRNKFTRDSFSVSDLIKICNSIGWELEFKEATGQTITLNTDDIKNPSTVQIQE